MYAKKILHNHTDELRGVLKITVLERVRRYVIMYYILTIILYTCCILREHFDFFTKGGLVTNTKNFVAR